MPLIFYPNCCSYETCILYFGLTPAAAVFVSTEFTESVRCVAVRLIWWLVVRGIFVFIISVTVFILFSSLYLPRPRIKIFFLEIKPTKSDFDSVHPRLIYKYIHSHCKIRGSNLQSPTSRGEKLKKYISHLPTVEGYAKNDFILFFSACLY